MKFLLNLFKRAIKHPSIQALTEQDLAQLSQQINDLCDSVEEKNLTLVSNTIESTSGHNNYNLVKAAVYFVKKCQREFNNEYAVKCSKANYFEQFILYINKMQPDFESRSYDPDGVGGGTITDIVNQIDKQTIAE